MQHEQHASLAQGPSAAFSPEDSFGGSGQPAALMSEPRELQLPDVRFRQVEIKQSSGVFEVAYQQSDDEAGHGEILATT